MVSQAEPDQGCPSRQGPGPDGRWGGAREGGLALPPYACPSPCAPRRRPRALPSLRFSPCGVGRLPSTSFIAETRGDSNSSYPSISLSLLHFMVLGRQVSGLIEVAGILHTLEHARMNTREFGNMPHCRTPDTPHTVPRLINLTIGIGVEIFYPTLFQTQALVSRILQHPFQRDVGYPGSGCEPPTSEWNPGNQTCTIV